MQYKSLYQENKTKRTFNNNNENQQAEQVVTESVIKCKSNWEQKKNHHTIEIYVEAAENNFQNIL